MWVDFQGEQRGRGGSVVANRVLKGDYRKLTGNEAGSLEYYRAFGGSGKFYCDTTNKLTLSRNIHIIDLTYSLLFKSKQSCIFTSITKKSRKHVSNLQTAHTAVM